MQILLKPKGDKTKTKQRWKTLFDFTQRRKD